MGMITKNGAVYSFNSDDKIKLIELASLFDMAAHIDLVVIITPRPGKVDRVVELLQELSEFVKKNEPDTLKYEINVEAKQDGAKEVVMLETYKDRAAIGAHVSSKENKTFQKTLRDEDLLDGSVQMKRIKTVGGFSSRL